MKGTASTVERAAELDLVAVEMDDGREMVDLFDEVAHLPHSCFLDSSLLMERFGNYSFVAFDPYLVLTTRGRKARFDYRDGREVSTEIDPFDALKEALGERVLRPGELPEGFRRSSRGASGTFRTSLAGTSSACRRASRTTWACLSSASASSMPL